MTRRLFAVITLMFFPGMAHAYIGPGLGVGALAAALGIGGAILLALFAVVYYPIKRMRKKRQAARQRVTKPGE